MINFMATLIVGGWKLQHLYDNPTPRGIKVRLVHPLFPHSYMTDYVKPLV